MNQNTSEYENISENISKFYKIIIYQKGPEIKI